MIEDKMEISGLAFYLDTHTITLEESLSTRGSPLKIPPKVKIFLL